MILDSLTVLKPSVKVYHLLTVLHVGFERILKNSRIGWNILKAPYLSDKFLEYPGSFLNFFEILFQMYENIHIRNSMFASLFFKLL